MELMKQNKKKLVKGIKFGWMQGEFSYPSFQTIITFQPYLFWLLKSDILRLFSLVWTALPDCSVCVTGTILKDYFQLFFPRAHSKVECTILNGIWTTGKKYLSLNNFCTGEHQRLKISNNCVVLVFSHAYQQLCHRTPQQRTTSSVAVMSFSHCHRLSQEPECI